MSTTSAAISLDGATPAGGAPIIETVGLTKTYPGTDFRAVDELNLSVGTGEVFGLLGPERCRERPRRSACSRPG